MKDVLATGPFKRDLRRMEKRGKNLAKLDAIVKTLTLGEILSPKHSPHPLRGDWHPKWDCHIEPDWVLIYEATDTTVTLVRTGTHSDLF